MFRNVEANADMLVDVQALLFKVEQHENGDNFYFISLYKSLSFNLHSFHDAYLSPNSTLVSNPPFLRLLSLHFTLLKFHNFLMSNM